MKNCVCLLAAAMAAFAWCRPAAGDEPAKPKVSFKKFRLDEKFRSEGVAVGDFNHDGKNDIAAGTVYYAGPDWVMQQVAEEVKDYDPHAYSNSFCNFADDLNGDGWTDLIVVDFPGQQTWWFENPQSAGGPWKRHVCIAETNNESPLYVDMDGDGKRELICGSGDRMIVARPGADINRVWNVRTLSAALPDLTQRYYHGLGLGDIDGDGRNDIVIPHGWWEGPADPTDAEWAFHPHTLGAACSHMQVYDFDGDGDNDVLSSSAHQVGIWFHEKTAAGWKTTEIDNSFSQTHSMCMADINGDGLPDFVTGKRFWAHGPSGDIDPNADAVMFWFELTRKDGRAAWIPHQFDHDSGVGTQFEVADVNGDGLPDVALSNKKGVHYFEQVRE